VALRVAAGNADIWIWDLVHKTLTRLTFEGTSNSAPLWTPDGKRVAFLSNRQPKPGIYWKSADGAGKDQFLGSTSAADFLTSWSESGKTLVFTEWGTQGIGIGMLSMEGDRKFKSLLNEKYIQAQPQVSPDGRWYIPLMNRVRIKSTYVRFLR